MALSRYDFTKPSQSGKGLSTAEAVNSIYFAVKSGNVSCTEYMLKQSERLDHIAAKTLGDSSLWWILAATSGIGWGLQCPPGTLVLIPNSVAQVYAIVREG